METRPRSPPAPRWGLFTRCLTRMRPPGRARRTQCASADAVSPTTGSQSAAAAPLLRMRRRPHDARPGRLRKPAARGQSGAASRFRCTRPARPAVPAPGPLAPHPRARACVARLTCNSSLTRSMGATAVLEMAAAMPPARKSLAKEMACSVMVAGRAAQRPESGAEARRSQGRRLWSALPPPGPKRRGCQSAAAKAPTPRPAPPRAEPIGCAAARPRPSARAAPPRAAGSRAAPRPSPHEGRAHWLRRAAAAPPLPARGAPGYAGSRAPPMRPAGPGARRQP